MLKFFTHYFIFLICVSSSAQNFTRSELSANLTSPWEIIYGPDEFLWISEAGGTVSRVSPLSGEKTTVFTATDYFGGSPLEKLNACFQPNIGAGTLGMALHPDFINPASSFIYLVYSYNSGTETAPATKFKIARLTWNPVSNSVSENFTLVSDLPTGYDHLGGRLMIIKQGGIPYLFFTVGDHGLSEVNAPSCYVPQSANPNNFAQDPTTKNGKIHRFNIDGSIPPENPIPGNSLYTRGHRNPQGLMFNPVKNIIYDIEHGDRTDDEINILEAGKNYGWKNVRGYHSDNNYEGESDFINAYANNPLIPHDALKEPLYAWCATPQPSIDAYLDWCTVAPSDGIYYGSNAIPNWKNSLLVVTLKNGSITDQELYRFKLNPDGKSLVPSNNQNPNPSSFFGEDQSQNGRLRDIAISPNGRNIYLINNGGAPREKITVYSYDGPEEDTTMVETDFYLMIYPNPSQGIVNINCSEEVISYQVYNALGEKVRSLDSLTESIDLSEVQGGAYILRLEVGSGKKIFKKLIKIGD